jgi:hypothetical protein
VPVVGGWGELSIEGRLGGASPARPTPAVSGHSRSTPHQSRTQKKVFLMDRKKNCRRIEPQPAFHRRPFHVAFVEERLRVSVDRSRSSSFRFSFFDHLLDGSVDDQLNRRPFSPCILLHLEASSKPKTRQESRRKPVIPCPHNLHGLQVRRVCYCHSPGRWNPPLRRMYASPFQNTRAAQGFDDDNVAKGPFSDVDFFASSGALPHPWSIHDVRLSRRLESTGDRWKEIL